VELKHEFEIGRPVAEVWERLLDLRNVAGALPGASVNDVDPDGTHHGTLRLKLGAFAASFRGTARYTTVDAGDHHVVLIAQGNSAQGQAAVELEGRALRGSRPDSTRVQLLSRVTLSGKIANFGARLASDVARQVLDQFVANLTSSFEGSSPGAASADAMRDQDGRTGPVDGSADALDLGSVLLPSWANRPVPLPVAVALAVAGFVIGGTLARSRRTGGKVGASLSGAVTP
jgi:carbon monoxide dehydrogenase subunit G